MAENEMKPPARWSIDQRIRVINIVASLGAVVLAFVGSIPVSVRAGICAGVAGMILLLERIYPVPYKVPPKQQLEIDHAGVRRLLGANVIEQVRWADLVKVSIVTTDEGPFVEDFFWYLHAGDGTGCVVPLEVAFKADLLHHLQRLPGFNDMAVIKASGSTSQAEFVCWEGQPGQANDAPETPREAERGPRPTPFPNEAGGQEDKHNL